MTTPIVIKTNLPTVDPKLGGGFERGNLYKVFGHGESVMARSNLCHHLCATGQKSHKGQKEAYHKVLYVDLSTSCTFSPDKVLKVAKSFALPQGLVLRRVLYGRISYQSTEDEIPQRQQDFLKFIDEHISDSPEYTYGLLIVNGLEGVNHVNLLLDLAKVHNVVVVINITDDHRVDYQDKTKSTIISIYRNENEMEDVSVELSTEKELKFPSKGFRGDKIAKAISLITDYSSGNSVHEAFDIWNSAIKCNNFNKKNGIVNNSLQLAFVHLFLNVSALTIEQLLEFKWKKSRGLAIAGLLIAILGGALWLWEIVRKWKSRERQWYTWPFFPGSVGVIVEVNQLVFYSLCLAHPEKPPRVVFSSFLFHVTHIIGLLAKDKVKGIKKKRVKGVV